MTSPCRAVARLVEGYLDGDLEPSQLLEVENHTQACSTCRERIVLDRAIRIGVRRIVARAKPTAAFRARVAGSIRAHRFVPDARAPLGSAVPNWGGWFVAAAAAALAVLGINGRKNQEDAPAAAPSADSAAHASVGLDALIEQFVDWHARPLPPEVTNPNDLSEFEPYVGVPVRPPSLSPFGARLIGGRMVQHDRVAAMLQYTLGSGHRVSVYVYDPRRISRHESRLQARMLGNGDDPVYVGHIRGWSVADLERRGVGVAIASDLNDDESAELALAAAP